MRLRLSNKLFDYLRHNWCKEQNNPCLEQFCKDGTTDFVVIEMDDDMVDSIMIGLMNNYV